MPLKKLPQPVLKRIRPYYSVRRRLGVKGCLDVSDICNRFYQCYYQFKSCGYFDQAFGTLCVDGDIPGYLGDVELAVSTYTNNQNIWPIHSKYRSWTLDDLFDCIEFLFDHCSKPLDGSLHGYNDCGWHFTEFEEGNEGKKAFREEINTVLQYAEEGYSLSENGEVLIIGTKGLDSLLTTSTPSSNKNITQRIDKAIAQFRRSRTSIDSRRDAVSELADILEYIRPDAKLKLQKRDENELFDIINNFGIRHHNQRQKTAYNEAVWLSWMFHYFLATIHAILRLPARENSKPSPLKNHR